jgi:hypothetical protein
MYSLLHLVISQSNSIKIYIYMEITVGWVYNVWVLKKYTQQNICKHAHSDQPIHDHIIYEVIVVPYNLRGNSCTLYHDNKKRKICLEIIVPYACTWSRT